MYCTVYTNESHTNILKKMLVTHNPMTLYMWFGLSFYLRSFKVNLTRPFTLINDEASKNYRNAINLDCHRDSDVI